MVDAPPAITSGPTASVTQTGATLSWTTNEDASSVVEYGITTGYGTRASFGLGRSHNASLTGLTAGTTYHYRLHLTDTAGNSSTTGDMAFTTTAAAAAPRITGGPTVSNVAATSVTIAWTTDSEVGSVLQYGTTTAYGMTHTNTPTRTHSAPLTGLTASTTYHYRISVGPPGGATTTGDYTFTTAAAPVAPRITSGPTVNGITQTGATVTWTTDLPATTTVEYGLTDRYGQTAADPDGTSHEVTLRGLQAGTTYHYRVRSALGAALLVQSADNTFATLAAVQTGPSPVSGPTVSVSQTTASIWLMTDRRASVALRYGASPGYGYSVGYGSSRMHVATLTGLNPGTTYHYSLWLTDDSGTRDLGDATFTTTTNATERTLLRTLDGGELMTRDVNSVAYGPDTALVASAGIAPRLWRTSDGQLVRTLGTHNGFAIRQVTFSSDGTLVATAGEDNTVKVWRVSDGTPVRSLSGTAGWSFGAVAFSPDAATLAAGSRDRSVKLWRVADGSLVRTLTGDAGAIAAVAFTPDGATLASGSDYGTIRLWRASDGTLLRTLTPGSAVNAVAFSPDGTALASCGRDSTVKLWRTSDGTLLRSLVGHASEVRSVAFAPDGATLASGGRDQSIMLWRASDGALLRLLSGHTNMVKSVAYSANGTTLVSGSADGTLPLWRVSDAPVAIAPRITSGPTVSGVAQSGATIAWTTSLAGTSVVDYGATAAYGSQATGSAGTSHRVTLSGLRAGTTYHFRVRTVTAGQTVSSRDSAFTTTAAVPATTLRVRGFSGSQRLTSPATATVGGSLRFEVWTFTRPDSSDLQRLSAYTWRVPARLGRATSLGRLALTTTAGVTDSIAFEAQGAQASFRITTTPGAVQRLAIEPADVRLVAGQQQTFRARALDAHGNEVQGQTFGWHVVGGIGTISARTGAFTAGRSPAQGYVIVVLVSPLIFGDTGALVQGTGRIVVEAPRPTGLALHPNAPNPFNSTTQIAFEVPEETRVRLAVYDLLGQAVALLADQSYPAGVHRVRWEAADLPTGLYVCRLQAGGWHQERKMLLVR
ncbi:MAG: fibronectin type III domain-containing protein [Candidatus Latescibacterota bacterium]